MNNLPNIIVMVPAALTTIVIVGIMIAPIFNTEK